MAFTVTSGSDVWVVNGGTGTVTTMFVGVARMRWVSALAAAGDKCVVTDSNGVTLFESEAAGANWSDEVELGKVPAQIAGLLVTTLTSGNLYIYLR